MFRRRPPQRARTLSPEEKTAVAITRSGAFLREALFWLEAMENFRSMSGRHAPRRGAVVTYCNGDGGKHWTRVSVKPSLVNPEYIVCAARRDNWPEDVFMEYVVAPLKNAGFRVGKPRKPACGCTIVKIYPRSRP